MPATKVATKNQKSDISFVEGSSIFHPLHGVGTVVKVGPEKIGEYNIDVIQVAFDGNQMTVRVPVAKAASVGLRKLSTPEQVRKALSVVGGKARTSRALWGRRAQEYALKINSGDPVVVAEVIRDLKRNVSGEHSYSERQVFEAAVSRLADEIAAIEGRSRHIVVEDIISSISASGKAVAGSAEIAA